MIYSIDTSAILDGWVRYYPPDIFPALWNNLDGLISDGRLLATEEVLVELKKKDDEVYNWFHQRKKMFLPLDEKVQLAATDILSKYERLVDTSKNRSTCDPFVIAVAQVLNCPVVTGEKPSNSLTDQEFPTFVWKSGLSVFLSFS